MATLDDVRSLGYTVDLVAPANELHADVYVISGFGITTNYVQADDQATIDSLADTAAHTERKFQFEQPEASAARFKIIRAGFAVTRPDPTVDVFTIAAAPAPAPAAAAAAVALAPLDVPLSGLKPADLVTHAALVS